MRSFLLMLAFIFVGVSANAEFARDRDKIPQEVLNSLGQQYPRINPEDADWEREDFHYKAEFELDNNEHEVRIDPKGNIISIEKNMAQSELPMEIQETLSSEVGPYTVDDAVVHMTNEETYYKVEIDGGDEFIFDEEGQILDRRDG